MRSVAETIRALRSLDKVLVEHEYRMTETQRESLTEAVFEAILTPEPASATVAATNANHQKQEEQSARII